MSMEWIEGFIIFSLIIWCCRNELYIRQLRKESVPNIWTEIQTLHKNDSTNHSIQPTSKITYTWKDEVEYTRGMNTSTSGGICTSLGSAWDSSGGKFSPSRPEPPQSFPDIPSVLTEVPGKPNKVYTYDYLPLNDLLDLMLDHMGLKPTRVPKPEEPKIFGLKEIEP